MATDLSRDTETPSPGDAPPPGEGTLVAELTTAQRLIEEGCDALLGAIDHLPPDLRQLLALVYVMIGHVEEQVDEAIRELTGTSYD